MGTTNTSIKDLSENDLANHKIKLKETIARVEANGGNSKTIKALQSILDKLPEVCSSPRETGSPRPVTPRSRASSTSSTGSRKKRPATKSKVVSAIHCLRSIAE